MEKAGTISEDELHRYQEQVQKVTDAHIEQVAVVEKAKEHEVMEGVSLPSVVGRELEQARRLLQAAGVTHVEVTETAPPARRSPTGPLRVVRQRATEQGVSLVVAASVPPPQEAESADAGEWLNERKPNCSPRWTAAAPAARRGDHGRQRPMGPGARAAARRRPPREYAEHPRDRHRLQRHRHPVAHAVCLLDGELVAPDRRSGAR